MDLINFSNWLSNFRFTAMATECKNPRFTKKIGTHDGVFHCDEALACFMLTELPEYQDAEIIRSRNSDVGLLLN